MSVAKLSYTPTVGATIPRILISALGGLHKPSVAAPRDFIITTLFQFLYSVTMSLKVLLGFALASLAIAVDSVMTGQNPTVRTIQTNVPSSLRPSFAGVESDIPIPRPSSAGIEPELSEADESDSSIFDPVLESSKLKLVTSLSPLNTETGRTGAIPAMPTSRIVDPQPVDDGLVPNPDIDNPLSNAPTPTLRGVAASLRNPDGSEFSPTPTPTPSSKPLREEPSIEGDEPELSSHASERLETGRRGGAQETAGLIQLLLEELGSGVPATQLATAIAGLRTPTPSSRQVLSDSNPVATTTRLKNDPTPTPEGSEGLGDTDRTSIPEDVEATDPTPAPESQEDGTPVTDQTANTETEQVFAIGEAYNTTDQSNKDGVYTLEIDGANPDGRPCVGFKKHGPVVAMLLSNQVKCQPYK
jgi:hypothetical protein